MVQWLVHPDAPVAEIDHTADIGIQIHGRTLPDLLSRAVQTLAKIITDPVPHNPTEQIAVTLRAQTPQDLLADLLREQLLILHQRNILCIDADLTLQKIEPDTMLCIGILKGQYDFGEIETEIKLVTYHQLIAEPYEEGWRGQVIFDV